MAVPALDHSASATTATGGQTPPPRLKSVVREMTICQRLDSLHMQRTLALIWSRECEERSIEKQGPSIDAFAQSYRVYVTSKDSLS